MDKGIEAITLADIFAGACPEHCPGAEVLTLGCAASPSARRLLDAAHAAWRAAYQHPKRVAQSASVRPQAEIVSPLSRVCSPHEEPGFHASALGSLFERLGVAQARSRDGVVARARLYPRPKRRTTRCRPFQTTRRCTPRWRGTRLPSRSLRCSARCVVSCFRPLSVAPLVSHGPPSAACARASPWARRWCWACSAARSCSSPSGWNASARG